PVAWQEIKGQRVVVDAHYVVRADGSIGYAVGAYDRDQLLTLEHRSALVVAPDKAVVSGGSPLAMAGEPSSNHGSSGPAPGVAPGDPEGKAAGAVPDAHITKLDRAANGVVVGYATNHMTPPLRDIKPIPPEKKGGKSEANEQANE